MKPLAKFQLSEACQGRHIALVTSAILAATVLLLNIVLTFIAVGLYGGSGLDGYGMITLFAGRCSKSRGISTGLHLIINVLSTLLLGASNYTMQYLAAPTRNQVDTAHTKGKWLDIGTQSMRNLRYIGNRSRWLWIGLALTSVPLHLLYNSVVVATVRPNEYAALLVTDEFLEPFDESHLWKNFAIRGGYFAGWLFGSQVRAIHRAVVTGSYARLDNAACIDAYAQPFTTRGDLVLVHDRGSLITNRFGEELDFGGGLLYGERIGWSVYEEDPYSWMCGDWGNSTLRVYGYCQDEIENIRADPTIWSPGIGPIVKYCLSEKQDVGERDECSVNLNISLIIVVIVFSLAKCSIIGFAAMRVLPHGKLLTVGDAVASFLGSPDDTTTGMCLITAKEVEKSNPSAWKQVRMWRNRRVWGFQTAPKWLWITCFASFIAILGALVAPLYIWYRDYDGQKHFFPALYLYGLAAQNPSTFMDEGINVPENASGVALKTMLANMPQLLLSIMYFLYNSLVTRNLLSRELNRFTSSPKGLRVSSAPKGDQRSTYFLQIPYRYAAPLQTISALLHWMVSQSLYTVYVRQHEIMIGYSPLAIFMVLLIGGIMLLALVVLGGIPLQKSMPLVGGCSVALAATCHPGTHGRQQDEAERKVRWGVMEFDFHSQTGHCGFSSQEVGFPIEGCMYAGRHQGKSS